MRQSETRRVRDALFFFSFFLSDPGGFRIGCDRFAHTPWGQGGTNDRWGHGETANAHSQLQLRIRITKLNFNMCASATI